MFVPGQNKPRAPRILPLAAASRVSPGANWYLHKPAAIMTCLMGSIVLVWSAPKWRRRSACQESMRREPAPDPTQSPFRAQLCSTGAVCRVDFDNPEEALARGHLHLRRHE